MNDCERHAEQAVDVYPSEAKRLIQLALFYQLVKAEKTKLYLGSQIEVGFSSCFSRHTVQF